MFKVFHSTDLIKIFKKLNSAIYNNNNIYSSIALIYSSTGTCSVRNLYILLLIKFSSSRIYKFCVSEKCIYTIKIHFIDHTSHLYLLYFTKIMATSLNIVILLSYLPHKYTGKLRDPYIKMLVIMPATLLYEYILILK